MLADEHHVSVSLPPWLDAQSSALVRDIVLTLTSHYPDLLAVVLFGSVARHEERPLSDPQPSDVDLLAIFDSDEDPVYLPRGLAIIVPDPVGQRLDLGRVDLLQFLAHPAEEGLRVQLPTDHDESPGQKGILSTRAIAL